MSALDERGTGSCKGLLYGIMLASANDAAYASAVHVGGSIDGFAQIMNDKAKELGVRGPNCHHTNENHL